MESVQLSLSKTLSLSSLVKARYSTGRVNVPVNPHQSLYARFKHVKGVPTGENGRGVSMLKLKTLDTLIDRLARMSKEIDVPGDFSSLSQGEIDSLFRQLEEQYRSTIAETPKQYGGAGLSETGLIISLFV